MSEDIRPATIMKPIARLRWRLRAQTATRWGILAGILGAATLLVGVTLHETWLLPTNAWIWFLYTATGLVLLGVLAGLLKRWDTITLAQRIDRSNDLKDRLGTALTLLKTPASDRTDFEDAQIRDAKTHAENVEHRTAAPWAFPREVMWVVLLLASTWALTFLEIAPPTVERAALRPVFLSENSVIPMPQKLAGPPPSVFEPELLEEIKVDVQEVMEENERVLTPLAKDDQKANKFVEKLNKTLQDLAEGKKSDRELSKEAADLEETLEQMAGSPEEQKQHEEQAKALEQVGEELKKQAEKSLKDKALKKEMKELAKALEERRYEDAAKRLEKLLDLFNKLPKKEQKRLAKMFEKLARKFQSKLSKQLEKLQKKRNRLNRKQNGKGQKSKKQRRRLNRLDKKLDRLKRQQKQQSSGSRKQLDKLSREMKKLADKMNRERKQKGQKGQKGQKNRAQARKQRLSKQEMKRLSEMMRRMGKQKRRSRLKRQGKMRLADLKELLKRRRGMGKARKKLERLARGRKGKGAKKGKGRLKQGQRSGNTRRQGVEWARLNKPANSQNTRRQGAKDGAGAGHGRNRMLNGPATDLKGTKTKEDFVKGQHGNGPSRKAILYGAASKGTRVKGYGKVHIDYSTRAARQMANEEIPPGYREYVEEYFRLIRKR